MLLGDDFLLHARVLILLKSIIMHTTFWWRLALIIQAIKKQLNKALTCFDFVKYDISHLRDINLSANYHTR